MSKEDSDKTSNLSDTFKQIIDKGHADVMQHYDSLRQASQTALQELRLPPNKDSISLSFDSLVEGIKKTRVRLKSGDKQSQNNMYTSNDLKRPADFKNQHLDRKPYYIDTAQEYGRIVHSMSFRRLQGKMQLFPPHESPLLRNRLTHSLEVADIAARITNHLNAALKDKGAAGINDKIDLSIVAAASLAHDLGHPPFGHTGEMALAEYMDGQGSFEGNAQTLRILTRLENRFVTGGPQETAKVHHQPLGLNLMYRTIAAVIKYDNIIPTQTTLFRDGEKQGRKPGNIKPLKGYYEDDKPIVDAVKAHVLRDVQRQDSDSMKTIECQIMDLADDIAYSTYDLEDCMIAKIIYPIDIISVDDKLATQIAELTTSNIKSYGYDYELKAKDISLIFMTLFERMIQLHPDSRYDINSSIDQGRYLGWSYRDSREIGDNPLLRRSFTETMIKTSVSAVSIRQLNKINPALMQLDFNLKQLLFINALRHYNFYTTIESSPLQLYAQRAIMIIKRLCGVIEADKNMLLLPNDIRLRYKRQLDQADNAQKNIVWKRLVCDYVASLTDLEAVRLFCRVSSTDERSIFSF